MRAPFAHRLGAGICLLGVAVFYGGVPDCSAIELSLHNEFRPDDRDGAILQIEEGRSVESPKSKFSSAVHPGKTIQVTRGNVTSFLVVWPFERHKLKYEVICPADKPGSATVTLVQIHDNKLPGGCEVSRMGHWSKRAGIKWTDQHHDAPLPSWLPHRRDSRE